MKNIRKDILHNIKLVVIKIGSGVIKAEDGGLSSTVIAGIARQIADLHKTNIKALIVSSGAIAAGIKELSLKHIPNNIPQKQAAAAIGQTGLMEMYGKHFKKSGLKTAQILLTHDDFTNRKRYLNAKNTISTIFSHNIIPIINENDTVSIDEIQFGDNDTLSAMVAALIEANLLIILSDVDGLYNRDPKAHTDYALIDAVDKITPKIERIAKGSSAPTGVGGMLTKIKAAKIAASSGIPTIIVNGKKKNIVSKVMAGEAQGTIFLPDKKRLKSRKHWIAYTLKPGGKITIDRGAKDVLVKKGKSLLPSGILAISGNFKMGDSISCVDMNDHEFARGLTNYSSEDLKKIIGKQTSHIKKILGGKCFDEVIHRDNLVLL